MGKEKELRITTLESNGITFDEDVRDIEDYLEVYPHASMLREQLLNFEHIISHKCFVNKFNKETKAHIKSNYPSSLIPLLTSITRTSTLDNARKELYRVSAHDIRFESARDLAQEAYNIIEYGNSKENPWQDLVKQIFKVSIGPEYREGASRTLDVRDTVKKVRVEAEDTWNRAYEALQRTTPPMASLLTAPKPDLYIALPIFQTKAEYKGFERDRQYQNFTQARLSELEKEAHGGLISAPLSSLLKRKIDRKHLVCFPPTVIEVKHHNVADLEIERCYCQAANAAAGALSLLNGLVNYSASNSCCEDIQPVVSFTFIGANAKVWLALIATKEILNAEDRCEYEMKCIWEGDLSGTWNMLQLLRIIDNLYRWIVDQFRPWVSMCLDGWRSRVEGSDDSITELVGTFNSLHVSSPSGRKLSSKGKGIYFKVEEVASDGSEYVDEEEEDDDDDDDYDEEEEEDEKDNEEVEDEDEEDEEDEEEEEEYADYSEIEEQEEHCGDDDEQEEGYETSDNSDGEEERYITTPATASGWLEKSYSQSRYNLRSTPERQTTPRRRTAVRRTSFGTPTPLARPTQSNTRRRGA
ncbi:hypothetical protein F5884DRAFT_885128 [Xylogone sp. PMI_703]|nr:hypothetical protein F5884DRAFT_885128 [Xylogone sp. PMI_703]